MIEQFRRVMATTAGKAVAIVMAVALLGLAVYSVKQFLQGDTPPEALYGNFVCSETGKSFQHKNAIGDMIPILSPFSGKNTGYPGEPCFWTKDGKTKTDPTWVLLNTWVGKPEPTFCPDCGRLVVGHNPQPSEGSHAPPTREEWFAEHRP